LSNRGGKGAVYGVMSNKSVLGDMVDGVIVGVELMINGKRVKHLEKLIND
jgi:hypothetical protein